MHKVMKALLVVLTFGAMTVDAAEDVRHSYTTGQIGSEIGDDIKRIQWLSAELMGPGVAIVPWGTIVGETKPAQIGWFSNLVSDVTSHFTNGVILSTGRIDNGATITNSSASKKWGVNGNDDIMSDSEDWDDDLARSSKVKKATQLMDAAGLVLYVNPQNKTINIPFMMASEEFFLAESNPNYNVPKQASYLQKSDKFAFFIAEKNKEATDRLDARDMGFKAEDNIARLPDGDIVEIASVNQHTNQAYFVANVVTNGPNTLGKNELGLVFPTEDIPIPMEYNGAIIGPTAVCTNVIPGKTYTIKIVIADYNDRIMNSVIFLKDHGITSGADLKIDVSGPAFINEPGNVVFTNTISNIGPAIADGVVITNTLPIGATFVCCEPDAAAFVTNSLGATNGVVWAVGDRFSPGSNAVMTVTGELSAPGLYTNSAVVVTSTGDYDEKNNADECVTQVGGEIQEITVRAITANKLYGTELALPGIQFIASLDGTNGEQSVMGVDVKFFKDGVEAFPTNKSTSAGVYQICLTNINISGLYPSAIIHYENGELTNECRVITIKANDTNKVYGASLDLSTVKDAFTVLDEGDGLAEGERVTEVSIASDLALETSTPAGTNYNAITLVEPFEVSGQDGFNPNNYVITPSNGTLVVDKRKITITLTERNRDYGDDYTLTGRKGFDVQGELASGDKIDTLDLKCDDGVAMMATCGVYKVTVEGVNFTDPGKLDNYEITTVDGELYVNAIELVIIASDTNKVYGSELTFLGTEFTTEPPVKSWDAVTNVNLTSIGRFQTATSGVYVITAANATGRGLENYEITEYRNGTLTVTNAPLTIIANDTNKVYGAEFSFVGDEYKTIPEDLYNTDEITNLTLTSVGTNRLAACAEYPIVVTNAFGIGLENYDITYLYGTLTVTNAPLMIIANSMERMYGEEIEGFQGTEFTTIPEAGNLPNGESVTNVTLTCTLATNKFVEVGEYREDIVPSHIVLGTPGFSTNNYDIVFSNGTLTVSKALLTITANTTNKVYGQSRPFTGTEFAITKGNLLDGDTITNVTLTCFATNAMAGCSNHVIGVTQADGRGVRNYTITYVPGEFKVKPFKITIMADDTNKVYGSTVKFSGTEFTTIPEAGNLPNGETVTNVTLTSVGTNISASVTETYDIVPSHVVSGDHGFHTNNYDISFENGTLTVTQALLTVKVNDAQYHIRRDWPPSYSVKFLPKLVDGDTEELMAGPEGIGYTNAYWTAQPDKKVDEGVYTNEIWATLESFTGPRATNYWIMVEPGNLEVLAAMPELKVTDMKWKLRGATGLFEGTLTIKNVGDGDADTNCNYWVELMPGPATNDTESSVPHAYYLHSRTGTIPGGPGYQDPDYVYEYQDLTEEVRGKLLEMHPASAAFGTNESVTVDGISIYHWKRYNPSKGYFNTNEFFVVGHLYNPSDNAPTDFIVSKEEKEAAKSLLKTETGVSDYLEMSRLNLLQYYHWNTNAGTWKGPSK